MGNCHAYIVAVAKGTFAAKIKAMGLLKVKFQYNNVINQWYYV
jgi:hypothetical protein